MTKPHTELKTSQRAERENWPEFLALRVHRAFSWLDRAERCDDDGALRIPVGGFQPRLGYRCWAGAEPRYPVKAVAS